MYREKGHLREWREQILLWNTRKRHIEKEIKIELIFPSWLEQDIMMRW
jgi:hypothetical protein